MSKPAIVTVDDDPQVSAAITRDLASRYAADYRIVRTTSGAEALDVLVQLTLRDEAVALIVTDQRMPQMSGIDLLTRARTHCPEAKFLLLTAYADTDVAISAINDIGLDYYLLKPWDPPAERLYPVVDDLLDDWQSAHVDHSSEVRVVGHRWSDRSHETKMFLAHNHVPYHWYDIERDSEATRLVEVAGAATADLPLVLVPGGDALRAPTSLTLAAALGLQTVAQRPLYDVCIAGGGPAGLAAAVSAAERGFAVTLFEKAPQIGGQFRLAMAVPGKEDFAETLRYYGRRLEVLGVDVRLATEATAADLSPYDEVIVSTGVVPREVDLPGADHPTVVSYAEVLSGAVTVGKRAAVIGAGGIGVDVSHFLTHDPADTLEDWMQHWGVGDSAVHPGGVTEKKPRTPVREVFLLQRKTSTIGKGLGKTSGWAHRTVLKDSGVQMIPGVTYDRVSDAGLHITVTDKDGATSQRVLDVDHVVVCAGQESVRGLYDELAGRDGVHLVGGADVAAELDAKRAIAQGTRTVAAL